MRLARRLRSLALPEMLSSLKCSGALGCSGAPAGDRDLLDTSGVGKYMYSDVILGGCSHGDLVVNDDPHPSADVTDDEPELSNNALNSKRPKLSLIKA